MNATDHPFGYFADPDTGLPIAGPAVHAEWLIGSRDMRLDVSVLFVDPNGRLHRVPVGATVNGLSVPRLLYRICWPFEQGSRDASVIHDWLVSIGHDWNDAAWVFWCAMRARGVRPCRAWIRWAAVRYIGKWFYRRGR